jgi:hypothetical protein
MAVANVPANCFGAAEAVAGGKLSRSEIEDAVTRLMDEKERLQRAGATDRMSERLRDYAAREAERTKIAAAMQRRHAALNALVRDRLDRTLEGFIAAGMTPQKALLAVMEGTQRGVEGGRNSVAAQKLAYEARYIGGMVADLAREVPSFQRLLDSASFDAAVMREMHELRDGGAPGVTGNRDAQKVAAIFARYAELARGDANRFGASIGKLQGWSGPQVHDDLKMIAAGKEAWVDYILPRLDLARTFEDVKAEDVPEILGEIYDTIITGLPNRPTPREKGARVNPANLARSLGKSRVLHFKDTTAALQYRDRFGHGNATSSMFAHLRRVAGMVAQMEVFGPNPEIMVGALVDSLARKVKEGALPDAVKAEQIAKLVFDGGAIRDAFDVMSGLATRPVSTTAADIGATIRGVMATAKLGGAVLSAIPSDTMTAALASQFRGSGFFRGLVRQLDGIRRGRPAGELAEITFLAGEGFDGIIGQIVSPHAAMDGPVGRVARLQETFFRWSGLTWWTDVARGAAVRTIAAEMGMRAGTAFDALPANYRHVLGLHGIDAAKWDAIRSASFMEINGNRYITADRMRHLPDATVAPVVAKRLASVKGEDARAAVLADGRRELEMTVRRFFADEVTYAVVETDARSRRTATGGAKRPGTFAGEAIRYFMQFKGFPIAFTQRVVGRAVLGHRADAAWVGSKGAHIGSLLAGMGMAGYMAMTMKDIAKGYWPPRDPTDPKVILAALQQGGALGIYGDFLFGEVNRYGGDVMTTFAGPTVGAVGDLAQLWTQIKAGAIDPEKDVRAADFLSFAVNNMPFANLAYVRPAVDFLFLNSWREALSPGYQRRVAKRRMRDYGQRSLIAP